MDLWRMLKDASDLERMTNDPSDNWFLLPSPDGKSVLYLSYAAGTEGHPRNKHVELRLFSLNDGNSLKLLSLSGGQGTINVASWNKKGTQFVFVDVLQNAQFSQIASDRKLSLGVLFC